jgi:hypothetical protein
MKKIKPVFLGIFKNEEEVKDNFSVNNKDFKGVKILFAQYYYEDYSGSAFVLFKKGHKYYEVNGSHCSCFGLEGQWEPEEVLMKELINRAKINSNEFCYDELDKFLQKNFKPKKRSKK